MIIIPHHPLDDERDREEVSRHITSHNTSIVV